MITETKRERILRDAATMGVTAAAKKHGVNTNTVYYHRNKNGSAVTTTKRASDMTTLKDLMSAYVLAESNLERIKSQIKAKL